MKKETLTLMMENGHVKANGTGFKNEKSFIFVYDLKMCVLQKRS